MLLKPYRLCKKKEIELVFKKGKTFKYQQLILKSVNNQLKHHRFAILVSKKISQKATVRNKIKRQLREIIRLKLKTLKIKNNQFKDNLLITLPGIEKKDFSEKTQMVNKLWQMAHL